MAFMSLTVLQKERTLTSPSLAQSRSPFATHRYWRRRTSSYRFAVLCRRWKNSCAAGSSPDSGQRSGIGDLFQECSSDSSFASSAASSDSRLLTWSQPRKNNGGAQPGLSQAAPALESPLLHRRRIEKSRVCYDER